jgi:DNA-binding transcriptional ArsR family regulator
MSSDDAPTTLQPPSDGGPDDRQLRKITDARTLRALAHPVRISLFEELALGGAMTATQIGERIGESATTCSFHLRQLAKYGFVEEAGGGTGRSRPWRLTSVGMSFSPSGDMEAEIASDAVVRMFRERQFERYQAWRSTKASYPLEWRKAATDSQYLLYLTAPELQQLSSEVHEVLQRWVMLEGRFLDPSKRPAGSVPVEAMILAHPVAPPASESDPGDA